MPGLVCPVVPAGRIRNQSQPILRVDELTVRPWQPSDADSVVAAYADRDIQQWHAMSMTASEAAAWLSSWTGRWQAETGAGWAVTEQDVLVGRVGLRAISLAEGQAEVAYWTVPAARGRNIAARSVRAVSTWVFQAVGLNRLELNHSTLNAPSCRIAHKAGFRYEGTKRRQFLHQDGWHDMHLHARLADDEIAG
ncbi:MAG TPA: GNAT family N-acetyltransferase [Streptosporangiaceae bacterium]|jgi:RimJ/RimL family protein N-acetyltransferase|nr:GNAT family N-acetyltransferase [Streptosporangiaceae bacterium]